MDYNNLTHHGYVAKFHCYGIGTFDVFSGKPGYINKPECSYIINSSLPPGQYWIVDRPAGGISNRLRGTALDWWNGTDHSSWLGIYSSQTMSDHLFVNGVERGGFRIHPLRPNGEGESWGCITFFSLFDFNLFRSAVLNQKKFKVPGKSALMAYGRIDVTGSTNFGSCILPQ
ncbi:DUF2778 domain-containing protein [Erwinia aphidicola]|uniref:DUF2778 domain-containing protein n=1 Tax=Erwinia aphidicola TaxID=68334 RepID=UPI0020A09D43|nr:DUF2778 domain-containing protein [Erwinia aphidicola]MCP2230179.1 hypothetical protein [Erwinia aphidicola]